MFLAVLFWKGGGLLDRRSAGRILGAVTSGAFCSSGNGVAFPALAVKSVIAPSRVDVKDQSSTQYRQTETRDVVYTIRTNPITGIGFGHPFLRPYVLPAITSFQLAAYVTHNSILWIWMNIGIGGFLAMLYLFAIVLRVGARTIRSQTDPDYTAITLTSAAFVLMYAIFTYVDISWDPKNMLVLALAMAQIDHAARSLTPVPGTSSAVSPEPTKPTLLSVTASSSS